MEQETLEELIERMVEDCKAELKNKKIADDSETEMKLAEKYVRQSTDNVTEER